MTLIDSLVPEAFERVDDRLDKFWAGSVCLDEGKESFICIQEPLPNFSDKSCPFVNQGKFLVVVEDLSPDLLLRHSGQLDRREEVWLGVEHLLQVPRHVLILELT